jgi:hypothetical protein
MRSNWRLPQTSTAVPDAEPFSISGSWRERAASWGPWQVFWLAFAIRVVTFTALRYYHVRPQDDHFEFGWEMGRVARALDSGRGYADPFHGHTGPTAWVTPLYPLLLAAVFKVFGIYTAASAWVILCVDSVLNALVVPLIWAIGERVFGRPVARWSAWIWALYPAAMQFAVKWFWEMSLTLVLFQAALLLALIMRGVGNKPGDGATWPRWLLFGLLWGAMALSNPGVLTFLPACGIWILAAKGRNWWRDFPKAFAAGLLFLAIVAPWGYRNWRVLHAVLPMRSNFGAELYLANGPGATGISMEYEHPNVDLTQFQLYDAMGELAYSRWRGDLAAAIIRRDLARFSRLCLTRVYFFWAGIPGASNKLAGNLLRGLNYAGTSCVGLLGLALALKRRRPAAGLLASAFLLYPLSYYVISAAARFRHPLEPMIDLLAVYLFQQAELRWGFSIFRQKLAADGA